MKNKGMIVVWVLLGIVLAVGLFCLAVCIGGAVNGLKFTEQITEWFGKKETADVVEKVAEATSAFIA